MLKFNIGYIQNSNLIWHVYAKTLNEAKEKFCKYVNIAYPNSYVTSYKSDIGKNIFTPLELR